MKPLLLTIALVAAACGGGTGPELTAREYSEAMNDAFFAYDQQLLAALSVADNEAPGALDAGVRAMADQTGVYADFVGEFAPPSALRDEHTRYRDGLVAIADVLSDAAERFADPDAFTDDDGAAFEERIEDEGGALSLACRELTLAASNEGEALRLECERWG